MLVKLRINRVADGHRQRRGKQYDLPPSEARTLIESGRAEAVDAAPVPKPAKGKSSKAKE
jgi:hypothetical protein